MCVYIHTYTEHIHVYIIKHVVYIHVCIYICIYVYIYTCVEAAMIDSSETAPPEGPVSAGNFRGNICIYIHIYMYMSIYTCICEIHV